MIIEPAIKTIDGKIYTGRRHYNILLDNKDKGINFKNGIQGFMNDKGEFLDRKEALKEAEECNQIKEKIGHPYILFSEDLC